MTKYLTIPLAIIAVGCAGGLNRVQADCETRGGTFPQLATCLRANFQPSSAHGQHYLATADHLAAEVRAGRMTDSRARLELAQLRRDIAAQGDAAFDRAMQRYNDNLDARQRALDAQRPPPPTTTTTDCYRDTLGNVHCTSRTR